MLDDYGRTPKKRILNKMIEFFKTVFTLLKSLIIQGAIYILIFK